MDGFLIHPTSCGAQNIHTESGFDQVDSIATMAIKEKGIPSLAIGVVKDGHVVYSKTYGFADVENEIPVASHTVYQFGSVTKTFVGLVLANLVKEEKIALYDPLPMYFLDSLDFQTCPNGEIFTVQGRTTSVIHLMILHPISRYPLLHRMKS